MTSGWFGEPKDMEANVIGTGYNIYYIGWVQGGGFGLSAVIIATDEKEALGKLDLDRSYNSEISISLMGICTDGTKKARVVCRESL
mgnify:CR=1 FL=1